MDLPGPGPGVLPSGVGESTTRGCQVAVSDATLTGLRLERSPQTVSGAWASSAMTLDSRVEAGPGAGMHTCLADADCEDLISQLLQHVPSIVQSATEAARP